MLLLQDKSSRISTIELHGFCDGSEKAYAVIVYFKSDGSVQVALVTTKTKITPIKGLMITHLELCGAYL